MPHYYNQRVFSSLDVTSPLLRSYLLLVGVELALKNRKAENWLKSHRVEEMIAAETPALQALAQNLRVRLTSLWCEKKGGGSVSVSGGNYPELRYLRHDSDFPGSTDASSESDLRSLQDTVDDLVDELKREGILS